MTTATGALAGTHVAFVVNVDWFFLSHRLPMARAARDAGARVTIVTADTGCGPAIEAEGLGFHPVPFTRRGTDARQERLVLASLVRAYRSLRPDLLHHVTIKPVLYGSFAAAAVPRAAVVNAISGLGFTFTAEGATGPMHRAVRAAYRVALRHHRSVTIFQNDEDRMSFVRGGLIPDRRAVTIRGSGVDVERFAPRPEPEGPPVVVLPARLLRHKGVVEFVGAAELVRARRPDVRFVLVGDPDAGNPTSIQPDELDRWVASGVVEWWGHRTDMHDVLPQATVVALPSYREGLPKALLEAAACGRAMVATDVPGCREVVRPGETGILVPVRDPGALAGAIELLLDDPVARQRLGHNARVAAEQEFSEAAVVEATLATYAEVLRRRERR